MSSSKSIDSRRPIDTTPGVSGLGVATAKYGFVPIIMASASISHCDIAEHIFP